VIPLEIGAGRLTDESGRYLGSILLFKDLSEIRTLRNEIARNQRLVTVGRLAAGVAMKSATRSAPSRDLRPISGSATAKTSRTPRPLPS